MKRAALVAALLLASSSAAGAPGDTTWSRPVHAASNPLDGLPLPSAASSPGTAPITVNFLPSGPCGLAVTGVGPTNTIVCASNPVGSITFTDPVENTGTSTAPIVGLKFTNTDLVLGGGGVLEVGTYTGAIVKAAGATSTAFGTAAGLTVLGVAGSSSGTPAFIGPGTAGQVPIVNGVGTSLGFGFVPSTSITGLAAIATSGSASDLVAGTVPCARQSTFSGDFTNSGCVATISGGVVSNSKLATAPAFTVKANATGSTAAETDLAASGAVPEYLQYTGSALAWSTTVPNATVYSDGIATGTTQLASVAAASLTPGTIDYTSSVGDFFKLVVSSLPTTATTVVAASGKAGYQWVRMNVQNPANQVVTAWYVDPQAAVHACSDENSGQASSAPLCTMAELARRTHGASYPVGTTGVVVLLESSMASNDSAVFDYKITNQFTTAPVSPDGYDTAFNVVGVPTDLGYAGVVSSPQNGAIGTTNDIHFTDSGIPTSFTASGFLATNVIFKRTNGTPAWFWPAKDLGSKTIRVSEPNTGISQYSTLSNGDTYRVLQLPLFHNVAFPHPFYGFGASQVVFVDVDSALATLDGNESTVWFGDSIENLQYLGGTFEDCQLVGQQVMDQDDIFELGGEVNSGLARKPASGGNLNHWVIGTGTQWELSDEGGGFITSEGIPLIVDVDAHAARAQIQFFDISGSLITLEQSGLLNVQNMGGAGNSGKIFTAKFNASRITYGTPPPSGITSDGSPIQIYNTTYPLAGLPVVDVSDAVFFVPETSNPAFTAAAMVRSNASGYFGPATDGTDYLSPTTGVPVTRRINTTAPMTGGGTLASDLTIATPVFAGSTAGLVPASGGGTTNFLRADGAYAVPPGTAGSAITSLTGPVTGTGPGATATTVNLGAGGFSGVLPIADVAAPSGTGFVHDTAGAWDGAARAVNLASADVTGLLPVANIAPSGTSGWVLTTVGTSVVWQAQASPGVGTVTNVSGTTGQVNVVNNTSTPVISLPNVGSGSTYGGTGIASITPDAQGRIVSVVPANYQTALGFPAANQVDVSTGSGITGYSTFTVDPSTHVLAVDGIAVNGYAMPTNVMFGVNRSTNSNRDRVQFFLGGGALGATGTGDNTLFDVYGDTNIVNAGVTAGIYSTIRVRTAAYTGSGQTITEADGLYVEAPSVSGVSSAFPNAIHAVGDVLVTGDMGVTGTLGLSGLGGVGRGILVNDVFGDVGTTGNLGAGVVQMDGSGNVTVGGVANIKTVAYYTLAANPTVVSGWLVSSSATTFTATTVEYPMSVAATTARIAVNVSRQSLSCTTIATATIYVNNTNTGCSVTFLTNATGVFDSGLCTALGTRATSDVWGVLLSAATTGCLGSMDLSAVMTIGY